MKGDDEKGGGRGRKGGVIRGERERGEREMRKERGGKGRGEEGGKGEGEGRGRGRRGGGEREGAAWHLSKFASTSDGLASPYRWRRMLSRQKESARLWFSEPGCPTPSGQQGRRRARRARRHVNAREGWQGVKAGRGGTEGWREGDSRVADQGGGATEREEQGE